MDQKQSIRKSMLAKRQELKSSFCAKVSLKIRDTFLINFPLLPTNVVSGYWPVRKEVDPRPILQAVRDKDHPCVLPCLEEGQELLVFRQWQEGDDLLSGNFGIMQPNLLSPTLDPDIVLVPLAAFDRRGYRIGYGGGHYDRLLESLRQQKEITAIGLAYDFQRLDTIPNEDYDQPLDYVITETGLIRF